MAAVTSSKVREGAPKPPGASGQRSPFGAWTGSAFGAPLHATREPMAGSFNGASLSHRTPLSIGRPKPGFRVAACEGADGCWNLRRPRSAATVKAGPASGTYSGVLLRVLNGSGLDLFGILQAVAASADKGKPMSIDDVVAQYGDDAAKRAHAERKRAADPSQASAAGDPGSAGGAASLAAEAAQGGAAGGGDGEDGGDGGDEDDEPVDEIEGGGEAMPEDKAGAAALWSQPLVQASKVKEAYVLFAGGRAAGKSSLVATFLGTGRPDSSASSSALEYAFGRKSGASARDAAKVVAHCWELAGGTKLRTLTQVPLTTQRLPNATI
ncbi:dync2li1, partial [Symbiodinium microadriaticum]